MNLARLQQLHDRRMDRIRGNLHLLPEFLRLGLFVRHLLLPASAGPVGNRAPSRCPELRAK